MADAPTSTETPKAEANKGMLSGAFDRAVKALETHAPNSIGLPLLKAFAPKAEPAAAVATTPAATAPVAAAGKLKVEPPTLLEKLFGADDKDVQIRALQTDENPSALVFEKLADAPAFKTPEGKKAFEDIKKDKAFTDALNAAIKKDSTVAPGLVGKGEGGAKLDINDIAEAAKDPQKRALFTQLLGKVAENDNDDLNFGYLTQVSTSVQKKDWKATKDLLAKAGISDKDVNKGADPVGSLIEFSKNPGPAIAEWVDNPKGILNGLDSRTKSGIAGAIEGIVKMISALLTPGRGFIDPYLNVAQKLGGKMAEHGDRLRGVNTASAEPSVGQWAPQAKTAYTDDNGNAMEPSAKQKAQAEREKVAAGTTGDQGNVKVADDKRLTTDFGKAAANDPRYNAPASPQVASAAPAANADRLDPGPKVSNGIALG